MVQKLACTIKKFRSIVYFFCVSCRILLSDKTMNNSDSSSAPLPSMAFKVLSDDDVSMEEKGVELLSCETTGSSTQEERRQKRRKQRPNSEVGCCPVCGVTLRAGDTSTHLAQELEKLARLPQSRPLSQRTSISAASSSSLSSSPTNADSPRPSTSSQSDAGNSFSKLKDKTFRKGTDWADYERIRAKRLSRTRQKHRRELDGNDEDDADIERECPVCFQSFPPSEIQRHTQRCLRQAETEFEDEEVDVQGESDEGEFEEYEWCGVTRIRATTLLRAEGQLHAIGTKVTRGSEDEMVDVCDDEDTTFGPSQYSEEDLVNTSEKTCSSGPCDVTSNLMSGSVDGPLHSEESKCSNNDEIAHSSSTSSSTAFKRKASEFTSVEMSELGCVSLNSFRNETNPGRSDVTHDDESCNAEISSSSIAKSTLIGCGTTVGSDSKEVERLRKRCGSGGVAVIEALRSRVRELEEDRHRGPHTCRVCHGEYEKPLVSIMCWHVHCETCWMQALGAKKLCPQCCAITTATDLRRIYL